ncbi:hypothetical protein KKF81_06605 [Candidatus Micrarchaeota archaeon]|nr:hypothetical protein [Candidatus Micrarchaeota archaeon]MBU1887269.1 hypothetical protein [Candidatus Micrarchaeota archaeon]
MNKYILLLMLGILLFGCTNNNPDATDNTGPSGQDLNGNDNVQPQDDTTQVEVDDTQVDQTNDDEQSQMEDQEQSASEDNGVVNEEDDGTVPQTSGNKKALILGRSVSYNWMEYLGMEWQCDDDECATGTIRGEYQGYDFVYYGLEYPPEIDDSAIVGIETYGNDADVVFFKLCFVDFGPDDSGQLAYDNFAYVENVYNEIVVNRHKRMIVGNALPVVSAETQPDLVSVHRQYNQLLDNFAATHDGIQVLDLYGMTSNSNGALRSDYAVSYDDSHLNGAAYAVITPRFMELLED